MNRGLTVATTLVAISAAATALAPVASAAPDPEGAPPGSKTLSQKDLKGGVTYERYSNRGMSAKDVVSYYETELRRDGWQTVREGGGGSGWSDHWGYGGGGLTAIKNGTYFSVNAGGNGKPTYFEVCWGKNSQIVDNCQNEGQNQNSNSGGS